MIATAFVGLGANLGNARQTITAALASLTSTPGTLSCESASLYGSDPVDAAGPTFVNTVSRLTTNQSPLELLETLQAIELEYGRQRTHLNAPRTLDLDLLWYDGIEMNTPKLTLPHPRMHLRAFVLRPLSELTSALEVAQHNISFWLKQCEDQRIWKI